MDDKERIITDTKEIIDLLINNALLDEQLNSLTAEADVIVEMVNKLVQENSHVVQSQEEYEKKYNSLIEKYEKVKNQVDELQQKRAYKLGQAEQLKTFLAQLKKAKTTLQEWDDEVWMTLVESGTVHKDKSITFKYYNGNEVTVR